MVTKTVERLPRCDFRDLYPRPDAPGLLADLDEVALAAARFRAQYGGRLAHLIAPTLLNVVREYENLAERAARLASYATLVDATNRIEQTAVTAVNTIRVRIGTALSTLTFFPLELGQLSERRFQNLLRAPDAARYTPWLERLRAVRGHLLSDPAEHQGAQAAAVRRAEWVRRYDELMETLRVPSEHGPMSVGAALRLRAAPDLGARVAATGALATTLDAHVDRFTSILNALVEQKQVEDRRRGFHRPDGARNCLNRLGEEVDVVLAAVRARASLARRFYRLKAKWLGRDVLKRCDRAAPLPAVAAMAFTWQEAKAVVLEAFEVLSPEVAAVAGRFFEEGWIDAEPRPGKVGGSACYPTVPSAHPYVLMNYRGAVRDVLSLAHELAHGVHHVLAADNGFLGAAVPPVLAEMVAALAEIVVLDTLWRRSTLGEARDALLALKLEHLITMIFHHAAIHDFEWRIHRARQVEELTPSLLNELWILAQREFMGPAVPLDSGDGTSWTCVGHVFRAPFYAYSYVLGGALALSLHGRLVEEPRDVTRRYLSLLRLGGRTSLTALFDDRTTSVAALAATGLEALGSILETLESAGPAAISGSGVRIHTLREQPHE